MVRYCQDCLPGSFVGLPWDVLHICVVVVLVVCVTHRAQEVVARSLLWYSVRATNKAPTQHLDCSDTAARTY